MESAPKSLKIEYRNGPLTDAAKETVTAIIKHILQPLTEEDRRDILGDVCDGFDFRTYDPYDY